MAKKTARDIDTRDKRVLVRVDFNVPLDPDTNEITDDGRIRAALPTIRFLIDQGAKVILCSHLGRPKGQVKEELRLDSVAQRLSELLGQPVAHTQDCIGPQAEEAVAKMNAGDVLLLENLRFHPEEEKNDPTFAQALAQLADIYVNDAFGTAHRAHASTAGVAEYLPAVSGFLMEKEIEYLGKALADPPRPYAMIVGGAKVADKIALLENMLGKVNVLVLGGGLANTFLKGLGYDVGASKVEEDYLDFARQIVNRAMREGIQLLLPVDAETGDQLTAGGQHKTSGLNEVPRGWQIFDIGPRTIEAFTGELKKCRTIVWNGPMGVFELPAFANGTRAIAGLIGEMDGLSIVGGGETAAAVREFGVESKVTHVSTGGGASLEFLEGKVLPGVAVLEDRD